MSMKKNKLFFVIFILIAFIICCVPVFAKESTNKIVLEYPISDYKYKDLMYIQGYFETNNQYDEIITLVDDEIYDVDYNLYQRNDLDGYDYISGFYKTIDLTNFKDGTHSITVELVDNNKNILAKNTSNFNLQKYSSSLSLNYPLTNYEYKDLMYIEGVNKTDCPNSALEVDIDGNIVDSFSQNENGLFYKVLDTSFLSDGYHQLNVNLKDNLTGEILKSISKKVKIKQYDVDMNLNYPISNYQYKDIMYIEGNYTGHINNLNVKLFIDDKYIDNSFDVKDSLFYKTLNLNDYNDGFHTLKVSLYSGDNEIISKSKTFNMKKHESKINLEFPIENYLYNNIMYIQGWELSDCSNTKLRILVDDTELQDINRYERNDLQKYNYISASGQNGFYTSFDTTVLTNGIHEVKVILENSHTGEVLANTSKKINVKKFNAEIKFDYPLTTYVYKDKMYIQGYVDSDASDTIIDAYLDDTSVSSLISRYSRNDVNYKYNNYNQGFFGTLDVSSMKDGIHYLKVNVKSEKFKDEIIESKTIKFRVKKYDGIVVLESPTSSMFSNSITLTGYEMSELDNSYIKIFIDGNDITNTISSPINRTEYNSILNSGIYGGSATNATPGFNTSIDLSLISAGTHNIDIKLYTRLDEEISSVTKTILVYKNVSFGIDVSYHNTINNWSQIRSNGIDYVFIRAAYRGYGFQGTLNEDTKFSSNVHGANMAGMKIGAYVYSQAVNEYEAIQEANLAIFLVNREGGKNVFKLPIVFDTEYTPCWENGQRCGRADGLTKDERTRIARAFLETVKNAGYTPMIYSNKSFLYDNLDMNQLSQYEVWMANFLTDEQSYYPLNYPSNYTGPYQVWQYYSRGSIPGISGNVDLNIFYKQY